LEAHGSILGCPERVVILFHVIIPFEGKSLNKSRQGALQLSWRGQKFSKNLNTISKF